MCFFLSVAKPLHKKISENIEVVKEQMGFENRKGLHFSSVPTAFRQTWITTLAESTFEHQLSVPVCKNLATKDNNTNCPADNYSLQIIVYSKCHNDGLLSNFLFFSRLFSVHANFMHTEFQGPLTSPQFCECLGNFVENITQTFVTSKLCIIYTRNETN